MYYISTITPFTVGSPLVDNKISMPTSIGEVVIKLCELFILDTATVYE